MKINFIKDIPSTENIAAFRCLKALFLLFCVCIIFYQGQIARAQTPILEYKFNEIGTTASSTGSNTTALTFKDSTGAITDLHSADGLGVSGSAGDRAFDNTASTTMGGSGGRAEQADVAAIDALTSFTLQGWFKTEGTAPLGTNARLFYNFAGSKGFDLYGKSAINGDMTLGVDNGDADTSGAIYGDTQTWVFFAVTYDGTLASNNTKFYKGSGTSTVTQVGTRTVNKSAVDDEGTGLGIGNKSGSSNFPFDGFLDNIRIFGTQTGNSGALNLSQMETLRSGDIPPSIISTSPTSGITGVGTNIVLTATFNETMDASTIGTSTFILSNGGGNVSGTVSYSGTTASFIPLANLSASTTFTGMITTGVKDSTGTAIASNYTWSFTTGSGPDTTPPTVSSTIPANGATDVAINSPIRVTFSEVMDVATITTSTFIVVNGGTNVSGTVSYSGTTAIFTPSSNLDRSTTYTIMITTGVKDLTGNAMVTSYHAGFTTSSSPDNAPPRVDSTSPSDGATGVSINSVITATFSESMDISTIGTSTFTVSTGGINVSGTVSYNGMTKIATFTPASNLSFSTQYTATITTGVKDLAGNAKASESTWNFTTDSAPGPSEPPPMEKFTVNSVSPINGATDVPIDTLVFAIFSIFINGSTFNTDTFKLSDGSNEVAGTVTTYGATAIFTPLEDLTYNTDYTARITTRAQAANFAGTTLDCDYTWSFTTIPDVIQPTVISTSPANGDTNVPIDSIITVTFSEEIDADSITTDTIKVCTGSSIVSGTVTCSGTIATFTPASNLSFSTTYSTMITTGVKDLAGNTLATPYHASFTTISAPDTTPPTVVSTNPTSGDTGVPVNSAITAIFSEEMDAATITTDTFIVSIGADTISGTVSYNDTIATFTPLVKLDSNTLCTATITTGAKDLAGNTMVSDYIWNFTTESLETFTPIPSVTATPTSNLNLSKEVAYLTGDTIVVTLSDTDRNTNSTFADILTTAIKVRESHSVIGTILLLDLNEDGVNSGTFLATITTGTTTAGGASSGKRANNGIIKATQGGTATVMYTDTTPLSKTVTFSSFDATISFSADTYPVGSYAEITLADAERNRDHTKVESLLNDVAIETSSMNGTRVKMIETGVDTGSFIGSIRVMESGGTLEFERIQVTAGDILLITYNDEITTTGFPMPITDTASVTISATPTPSVTTTPCNAELIEVSPKKLKLKKEDKGGVIVTLTGEEGCPAMNKTVTAKIKKGKRLIMVTPTSALTEVNGQATFTITAKNKTGRARVQFRVGNLETKLEVNIEK